MLSVKVIDVVASDIDAWERGPMHGLVTDDQREANRHRCLDDVVEQLQAFVRLKAVISA